MLRIGTDYVKHAPVNRYYSVRLCRKKFLGYFNKRGPGKISRYSDSLLAGRSGDRIPVGARFSAPVQTGPGAHPASYTMGTGSFPEVKRPGHGVDHPLPLKERVKERVGIYLYSPSGPSWSVLGRTLPLPLPLLKRQYRLIQSHVLHGKLHTHTDSKHKTIHTKCRKSEID